ncbi:MAG: hypothetical protein IPL23_18755 [Saprospiraceae bacterium]|nr:hypothetical protein [Saprospiraceae bacterium]
MKFQQKNIALLAMFAALCFGEIAFGQTTNYTLSDAVSISTINNQLTESWPTPGTIVIRRSGGLKAVTVPFTISGSATIHTDYQTNAGTSVTIPNG